MGMLLQKLRSLNCGIQPLLACFSRYGGFLDSIVEFGEHPHFTSLHPHEFVGIKDTTITFETVKETTKLGVNGVIHPKRDDLFEELMLILFGEL